MSILKDEYRNTNSQAPRVNIGAASPTPKGKMVTDFSAKKGGGNVISDIANALINPAKRYGGLVLGAGYETARFAASKVTGDDRFYFDKQTGKNVENPFLNQDELTTLSDSKTAPLEALKRTAGGASYFIPGGAGSSALKAALLTGTAGALGAFSEEDATPGSVAIGTVLGAGAGPIISKAVRVLNNKVLSPLATKVLNRGDDVAAQTSQRLLNSGDDAARPVTSELMETSNQQALEVGQEMTNNAIKQVKGSKIVSAPRTTSLFRKIYDRSRNIIESQGTWGKSLAQDLQTARDIGERTAGTFTVRMNTVQKLSKQQFDTFIDLAEGRVKPGAQIDEQVQQAFTEWDGVRKEIASIAKSLGVEDFKEIEENYFPHIFDPKQFKGDNFKRNIEHMVKTGQAETLEEAAVKLRQFQNFVKSSKYANLEFERKVNLPSYERTKEALFSYVQRSSERLSEYGLFGKNYEKAAAKLAKMAEEGYDATTASKMFDVAVGAVRPDEDLQNISKILRMYQGITKLGVSAVSNIGQTANTAAVGGVRRTFKSIPKAIFDEGEQEFAERAGLILDSVLNDLREGAGFNRITSPGFKTVETFNRKLAAVVAKDYANDLAEQYIKNQSPQAADELVRLGINPADLLNEVDDALVQGANGVLNMEQKISAARRLVERTQFKVNPQDLPGWASSPIGKLVAQFRTFSYNQSAFMYNEVLKPALKGNVAPLVRFMILGVPAGMTLRELRSFIRGIDTSEENLEEKLLRGFEQVGGAGLAGDVIEGMFPVQGRYVPSDRAAASAFGSVFGPSAGTFAEVAGSLSELKQGRPTSALRFMTKQIPLVGPTAKNILFPYKPRGGSSTELKPLPAISPR